MSKHTFFDDDMTMNEDHVFSINQNYASRYDKWRSKEEYEKLKARVDLQEEDEESSGDEDGKDLAKPDNPEFNREFLLSLGTIYKHQKGDVKLEDHEFFTGDYRLEKEKEDKPMTLKDFERHVIMQREGKFEDDYHIDTRDSEAIAHSREKMRLADGIDESDDDDGGDLLTSGLFKPKANAYKATGDYEEASQSAPADLLEGISEKVADTHQKDALETLKGEWKGSDKLSKRDKWLVEFFLKQRYLGEEDGEEAYNRDSILDEEELSSDEEEEPDMESNPLATQYKFRHQEPGDLLKRHPRNVPDSLRPKDERRKEKRISTKERQLQKKEEKRKEIELLKAWKYKEIEEKIDKIREASGNEDIDLGQVDLEEDFDPDAHDAYMSKMLGEDYFDDCNAEQEMPEFEDVPDDTKLYDNWTQSSTSNAEETGHEEGAEDEENDDYEEYNDGYFNMDADYPEGAEVDENKPAKSSTKQSRRRSKFSRALEKKKPIFDPKEKDFASYFDEYYKLDFEDVVGGMPCRFKYRKVESNDFGLTTGEILAAQNSDLNRWVGLKKIMQYNRTKEVEDHERNQYRDRASHVHVKQKILPSLFDEDPEDRAEREQEKRRLRNLKRKQKIWKLRDGMGLTENPEAASGENVTNGDAKDSKEESTEQPLMLEKDKVKKRRKNKSVDEPNGDGSERLVEGSTEKLDEGFDDVRKKKQKHTDQTEEIQNLEIESPKKKKRKRKEQVDEGIESTVVIETEKNGEANVDEQPTIEELVVKKKKKKKKHRDQSSESQNEETIIESPKKKTEDNESTPEGERLNEGETDVVLKKRKNVRTEEEDNVDEAIEDLVVKKKKKKHRDRDPSSDSHNVETIIESPKKKKKKNKHRDQDPSSDSQNAETIIESPKKKGTESEDAGIPPAEERLPQDEEAALDQAETNVASKKQKKSKEGLLQTETEGTADGSKKRKHKKGGDVQKVSATQNPIKKRKSKKNVTEKVQKMKKRIRKHKELPYFKGISNARLEAYGQNPKKLKNRVWYGKDF